MKEYDNINDFREDRSVVVKDYMRGVIDRTGKEIVPLKYNWISNFYEGRATMELNKKWGVINLEGEEVVPPRYGHIDLPVGIDRLGVSLGNLFGLIDMDGNEIVPPIKYHWIDQFSEGRVVVKVDKNMES